MSETLYQLKVERLQKEIVRLEQRLAEAAKKEARHRDSANRVLSSITRTTSQSMADSKRRQAASEERSADRERDKAIALQGDIAKRRQEFVQVEKYLSQARSRRFKEEGRRDEQERRARDRTLQGLSRTVGTMERELEAVTAALARELPSSITVLLLFADSVGGLRLDEEMRSIHQAIRLSEHRDHVRLEARWAARPSDISQALLDTVPTIVHISSHGRDDGAMVFQADDGGERFVEPRDIAGLVRAIGEQVRVVVFNACSSVAAAEEAVAHVEAAIGMDTPVTDAGARAFAEGFYRTIGSGKSLTQAFEVGRFELRNTPALRSEDAEPVLRTQANIDPGSIFLVAPDTNGSDVERRVAMPGRSGVGGLSDPHRQGNLRKV